VTSRLLLIGLLLAPAAAQADPRIATHTYEPASVVTVNGRAGIESTIAFADDERIENVAVGNSATWQVTPNKRANLLFVKPAGPRARTNMTVVTDQRTYLFDLVSGVAVPVYMLRFTYPGQPRKTDMAAAAAPPAPPPAPVALAAAAPVDAAPRSSPAELNFAWTAAGDRKLLPARTYDDGSAVFLSWPREATMPAILTRGPSGQEGPVNFTVKGETIVVDGVPAQIVLRSGKQVATLTPESAAASVPTPKAEQRRSPTRSSMAMAEIGSPQR